MNKYSIILISVLLGMMSQVNAQVADRLLPHFGYNFTRLSLDDGINPELVVPVDFNTISLGAYYTLAQAKDIVSVGLDGNVNFGLNFNSFSGINWLVQAPVFVMGRLGANSTVYNSQSIGLGAGFGLMGSFMNIPDASIRETYFNPVAVIEGTVNSGGSYISGRLMFSLADAKGRSDLFGIDSLFFTRVFSIGIVYGL